MRGFETLIDAFTPRIQPWLDLAARPEAPGAPGAGTPPAA